MAQDNRLKAILIGFLLASSGIVIGDDSTGNSDAPQKTNSAKGSQTQEAPQDKAYREEMLTLSNAIVQKISEIQAKQKELDNEIYPADKPPLQGELDNLKAQLDALKLRKSQLEAQKAARDMSKQMSQQGQNSTAQQ